MQAYEMEYTFEDRDYGIINQCMRVLCWYEKQKRSQESKARVYNLLTNAQKNTYQMFQQAATYGD